MQTRKPFFPCTKTFYGVGARNILNEIIHVKGNEISIKNVYYILYID